MSQEDPVFAGGEDFSEEDKEKLVQLEHEKQVAATWKKKRNKCLACTFGRSSSQVSH